MKSPATFSVVDGAVLSLLGSEGEPDDEQLVLAVELLERGCDCDAMDREGRSVLSIICDHMSSDLRQIVVGKYPDFDTLFGVGQ